MPQPTTSHDLSPLLAGARWARLARLATVCGRQMRRSLADQAANHGLNDTEFLLLWACREAADGCLAQNNLAASVGLSTSQISSLIERLRQRGLAVVERSRLDRRRQHWGLTAEGSRVLDSVLHHLAPLAECLDAELAGLEPDPLLERLAAAAQRAAEPNPQTGGVLAATNRLPLAGGVS